MIRGTENTGLVRVSLKALSPLLLHNRVHGDLVRHRRAQAAAGAETANKRVNVSWELGTSEKWKRGDGVRRRMLTPWKGRNGCENTQSRHLSAR